MTMTQPESLTMPIEDAMRTQRAIRRLKSDPVDDALVLHLLLLRLVRHRAHLPVDPQWQ